MKTTLLYIFLLFIAIGAKGQFYLKGEVKDEKFRSLQNVKIYVHSIRAYYHTGSDGSFGIILKSPGDTLTFSLDGFEDQTVPVQYQTWQRIILKAFVTTASKNRQKLISVIKDRQSEGRIKFNIPGETYFELVENDVISASLFPNTGYSLNVNKASYSNIRRFLKMNSEVPPDAVRAEELINYFNLLYHEPAPGDVFREEAFLVDCPWQKEDQLLFLNTSAKKISLEHVLPSNFVFLIDVSGSMEEPKRLPLIKAAFQMFVKNLRDEDKVSIVVYGGNVGIWLKPTSGALKDTILKSIEELEAAGDTPGEAALRTAYRVAKDNFIQDGNNRIILATDGDFNVGETSERALEDLVSHERLSGVYLTCLGVGMGNFKDSKLQTLAKKGNGNYAYLDDIAEAEKILVKELTQTLYSVADDAVVNLTFNPDVVKKYRLIGFDNRKEVLLDNSTDLEGGEVGSGNSTIAVFQITPISPMNLFDSSQTKHLAQATIRYTLPGDTVVQRQSFAINPEPISFNEANHEVRFAAALSYFAMLLKKSVYVKPDWNLMQYLADSSADKTQYLQAEFINLVQMARALYDSGGKKPKKKKGKNSSGQ